MREYAKIIEVGPEKVFQYTEKGWEIIDESKVYVPDEIQKLTFHLGYPAERRIEDLLNIINEYEKHGFKEKLFDMIAHENGRTAQYKAWYERIVKNENELEESEENEPTLV